MPKNHYSPTETAKVVMRMRRQAGLPAKPLKTIIAEIKAMRAAESPKQQNPARLPVGKKIRVNYIIVKRDGTVQASVPTVRRRNPSRVRNESISQGFYAGGVFHPIRSADDYDPEAVGETRQYAKKKKKAKGKKRR